MHRTSKLRSHMPHKTQVLMGNYQPSESSLPSVMLVYTHPPTMQFVVMLRTLRLTQTCPKGLASLAHMHACRLVYTPPPPTPTIRQPDSCMRLSLPQYGAEFCPEQYPTIKTGPTHFTPPD